MSIADNDTTKDARISGVDEAYDRLSTARSRVAVVIDELGARLGRVMTPEEAASDRVSLGEGTAVADRCEVAEMMLGEARLLDNLVERGEAILRRLDV